MDFVSCQFHLSPTCREPVTESITNSFRLTRGHANRIGNLLSAFGVHEGTTVATLAHFIWIRCKGGRLIPAAPSQTEVVAPITAGLGVDRYACGRFHAGDKVRKRNGHLPPFHIPQSEMA